MIPYIVYTAIIIAAFLIFYKALLQKETFFRLNRYVLLTCMTLAFVMPIVPVPQQFSFRQAPENLTIPNINSVTPKEDISITQTEITPPPVETDLRQTFNTDSVVQWLIYLYWFGVIIFGLNFLLQIVILLFKAFSKPAILDGKFRIVEVPEDKAPCSFANIIFINPEKYDWETYHQVLLHEKIHIEEKHTFDLLLTELMLIFQWFNPFAWQWRKELESNLEYFTDALMLQNDEVSKEHYQMSLLRVAAPNIPLSITTNYNQSLLKKRLIMMNSKKSNFHTIWKYFFLLPIIAIFICSFNEPFSQSQSKLSITNVDTKNENDNGMKNTGYWFATIKNDQVNIQFKNDDDEDNNNSSGTTFLVSELGTLPMDKQGTFSVKREAGTMEFTGKFEGNKGMGNYKFVPNKGFVGDMQKEGIDLKEDTDLLVFFMINIKESYVQMLKKTGFKKLDKDDLIPLAALKVDEAYINSLKMAGLSDLKPGDLIPLKSLNIDKKYIEEIRSSGYKDVTADKLISLKSMDIDGKYIADYKSSNKHRTDEITSNNISNRTNDGGNEDDDIIAFKSMDIDKSYINSIKENGYDNIANSDLIAIKSMGVTPEYIKTIKNSGYPNIEISDLIAVKSMSITPEYIKSVKNAGFPNIEISDLIAVKSLNITPEYIKSIKSAGYPNIEMSDLIAMSSLKIDEDYIKNYQNVGYGNIEVSDMIALKSLNITTALFKEYEDLGFKDLDIQEVISAKSTRTTPAFIKSMREKGHNLKSLEKYVTLRSVLEN
ncbi:MAG: peptidase M56, BlaR1 [Saprospiraceae bacterium]|jgi:hypothetical protein|nr:peptidase M56, BlaR1 [Saprospiraceae bacterium]